MQRMLLRPSKSWGGHDKVMARHRQLMMAADKDFQKYLRSGKKTHPFKDADKEWGNIRKLHKKVSRVITARFVAKGGVD